MLLFPAAALCRALPAVLRRSRPPSLPPLNWNGYDHTSTTILAQLQDRLLVLCRTEPYTRTTTGTDGAPYTIQSSHRYFGLISYADYLTGTPNYTEVGMLD